MKLFSHYLSIHGLVGAVLAVPLSVSAAMPAQPSLELATLDGGHFSLTAQRGHWVLINDWATWCVPCIAEMPTLSAFAKAHAGQVTVLGLAYDDSDTADIRQFLVKHPVSYPIAHVGLDHPPADFDEPRGLPTTWLIGPDGKVVKHFLGPVNRAQLDAAIRGGTGSGRRRQDLSRKVSRNP